MAQHDYNISNQSGAAFRADLNNALAAIVSQNSGAVEPSVTYAYQPWADTTTGLFKIRNAANSAWITLYQLDGEWSTIALENGSATAPSLYFKDSGTDTGLYSPGVDQLGVATAGVQRVNFNGATEVVFNDTGADVDFRIEGDTEPNLFVIDAGTDQVRVKNLNGGPLAGTRNRIINGGMAISQRNATSSVNLSSDNYTVDRWLNRISGGGVITNQQTTSVVPTGHAYALALTVQTVDSSIAAGDVYQLGQRIEGFNTADLAWGTASASSVTISFWVRSSVTGTYGVGLQSAVNTRSYVATYTVNSANTWEYKTITVAGDTGGTQNTNNSIGIDVVFDLGSGTSSNATAGSWGAGGSYWRTSGCVNWIATSGATFYITGVQLEPGTVATPFERRSYGQELAACQRYYFALPAAIGGAVNPTGASSQVSTSVQWPVVMRAAPTTTATGDQTINQIYRAVQTQCSLLQTVSNGDVARINTVTASAEL